MNRHFRLWLVGICGLALGLLVGGISVYRWTANERELGKLYPSNVVHRIRTDLRVLDLLKRDEHKLAVDLLELDIKVNTSTLAGLQNVIPIGDAAEELLRQEMIETESGLTNGVPHKR
jgi:hypothetical protein